MLAVSLPSGSYRRGEGGRWGGGGRWRGREGGEEGRGRSGGEGRGDEGEVSERRREVRGRGREGKRGEMERKEKRKGIEGKLTFANVICSYPRITMYCSSCLPRQAGGKEGCNVLTALLGGAEEEAGGVRDDLHHQ